VQNVVIEKPYVFVPPSRTLAWNRLIMPWLPRYLRKSHGLVSVRLLNVERLCESVRAGHGVLLTPNHCRPCDPMALFLLGKAVGRPIHVMASWHLFMQGRFQRWVLRQMGVFSVYREGMDRESLRCATQILAEGRRPLVLFPEGVISRTNDRLNHMMDGTVLIARSAAKQRAGLTPPRSVVIHPVAIRYFFDGDVRTALAPVLSGIERNLTWAPRPDAPIEDRIAEVGKALLTLKEIEKMGGPRGGDLAERLNGLIDHLLVPLETEWLKGRRSGDVVARVKALRTAILPDMVAGDIGETERARRWRQLADVYLAQQLAWYPPDYLRERVTPERLLETVERFEEDLTDRIVPHPPLRAVIQVGEAIAVSAGRERGADGDPIMGRIREQIEAMLESLQAYRDPGSPG
jgi:1-acyl-sn-glycerol-3-phosphate acyltransferase